VAPASDQEDFTSIFETLVNSVVREVEARSNFTALPINPRLLLMLDEAANCAPLRKLPTIASAGRGQGIQLITVWQDDSQIETIYGPTMTATINSNHVCKVILPGVSDDGTLERVSKLIGPHTVKLVTHGVGSDGRGTRSTQPHTEVLATPDYIRTIERDEVIVIVGRDAPMRLRVVPWYLDNDLRKLIDPDVAARFDAAFARPTGDRKRKALR